MKIKMMLAGLALAFCSVLSAQGFEPTATVFIDGGTLYGTSENGVLRADLETGTITLVDASGRVQEFQSPHAALDRSIKDEPMGLRFIRGPLTQLAGSCSNEARALQSSINVVQSACAGGNSVSCNSAIVAMHAAYDADATCPRDVQQAD